VSTLDSGKSPVFDGESRYVRKDGSVVWASVDSERHPRRVWLAAANTGVILDINARKQAEQALYAINTHLQLAMDAAQLGWWRYDPRHGVFSGDSRSEHIFDVAADETPMDEIMKRVYPDDAARFSAGREAALDRIDPKPYTIEFRLRRRSGEVRWLKVRWLAYFGSARRERGPASVVGTVADVTERKEREEKEHFLMREVNHRANNMLSVVDAIAHQTVIRNREDFMARFSERIEALSANQDLLARNEWNGVEIEGLVRAQLAPLAGFIGSGIAPRGPELRLKAASAQAIGLALHELATNCGKYGALSTDKGRVGISWDADGDTFTMSWSERDGPPVSARRGLGTIVMETMAERSANGTVDLDSLPSGLTWRLTCTAANALEPQERDEVSGKGGDRIRPYASTTEGRRHVRG